jgi:hypothetical protein|tara:strand:- start:299 stop:484 length:186 start_codon:yes stop_codon:yes gene_type:complete
MPDIKKYKSVAVPIPTWEKLWKMADKNHRSPAQQIAFLVQATEKNPSDAEVLALLNVGVKA